VFFFETQIRWFRFRLAGKYSQNPRVCELNRFVFLKKHNTTNHGETVTFE